MVIRPIVGAHQCPKCGMIALIEIAKCEERCDNCGYVKDCSDTFTLGTDIYNDV